MGQGRQLRRTHPKRPLATRSGSYWSIPPQKGALDVWHSHLMPHALWGGVAIWEGSSPGPPLSQRTGGRQGLSEGTHSTMSPHRGAQ